MVSPGIYAAHIRLSLSEMLEKPLEDKKIWLGHIQAGRKYTDQHSEEAAQLRQLRMQQQMFSAWLGKNAHH